MDKIPGNIIAGASYEAQDRIDQFPKEATAGLGYELSTTGAGYETHEGTYEYSENTTSGADYIAHDSSCDCDPVEPYTGNSRDHLPLPGSMDDEPLKDEDKVYPPISRVILIMASLLVSMFLVALVRPPAIFHCIYRVITLSRTG